MKGKEWKTRDMNKGLTVHTLKLNKDFSVSVTFCHDENDPNCAAPTTAIMDLMFLPMTTVACSAVVMNGSEDWTPGERVLRSRIAALNVARRWQAMIQKPVRDLKLSLKNAEA